MEGLGEILKLVGAIATIPDKVQDNAEQVSSRYATQMSVFVVALCLIDTPASSACATVQDSGYQSWLLWALSGRSQ
jgi:hypothetical protein